MAALSHRSTTVLETAIDYLTVSSRTARYADRWAVHCLGLQKHEALDGNKLRPWHLNGYVGQQVGRVRFGFRDEHCLVQLSGQVAADQFDYLWTDHDTCTRLDIAVTYRTAQHDETHAQAAYEQAVAYHEFHPRSARSLLLRNSDGGSTCYVGSRSSSRLLRIYDKHAEQLSVGNHQADGRYTDAWRVELELHDVAAESVGNYLAEPGGREAKIRHYLRTYLEQHGIECRFDATQLAKYPTGLRRRSDRESRIDWLKRTVRPTIDWLRSTSTEEELRDILGLRES